MAVIFTMTFCMSAANMNTDTRTVNISKCEDLGGIMMHLVGTEWGVI